MENQFGMLTLCKVSVATHNAAAANIMMHVSDVIGNMIYTRPPDFYFVSGNQNTIARESPNEQLKINNKLMMLHVF